MRNNAKQYVELTCQCCGISFNKEKKEYDRQRKKGREHFYCDLSCGKRAQRDILTPFRAIRRRHKHSADQRNIIFELSLEDIQKLWEQQKGLCSYTGQSMILPVSSWDQLGKSKLPCQASLDRIDSSKGYVQGNVEFVCLAINYAKNGFTKHEMLDFFAKMRS